MRFQYIPTLNVRYLNGEIDSFDCTSDQEAEELKNALLSAQDDEAVEIGARGFVRKANVQSVWAGSRIGPPLD